MNKSEDKPGNKSKIKTGTGQLNINEIPDAMIFSTINTMPAPHIIVEFRRRSGHYIDQKLKYNKPESQPTLWDCLNEETKELIKEDNTEKVVEGIRLTPGEDRLINAHLTLLQRKSNTKVNEKNKPAEPDLFFRGNLTPELVKYGGEMINAPMLRITFHEICTEYWGSKDYGGKEIEIVKDLYKSLLEKKVLIRYKYKRWELRNKKLEQVEDRIEEYLPLIRIATYREGLTKEEAEKLDKNNVYIDDKGEIIIRLNPVFIHQIDTKFIIEPANIDKRTEIACEGKLFVTEAIIRLRDMLIRHLSNKKNGNTFEIDEDRLPYALGLEKYIKEHRRKIIKERIKKAISIVIKLGLALEVNRVMGERGKFKYVFTLNMNFNK